MKNYFFAWSKLGAFGVILTMQLEPPKIEALHLPTVKWLTKMNRGWSVKELKTTTGLSSSPLPTTPKEDTNSNVAPEKEQGMSETRSNSDEEDAVCSESGYEADVNIHQRVGPKKKSWHK